MLTTLKIMISDRPDPMVMDDLGCCCFQKQSELILAMHAPGILLHQWPQYHQLQQIIIMPAHGCFLVITRYV